MYANTKMAWTGIVRKISPSVLYPGFFRVDVESHCWDWIEDTGFQKEKYFLAPKENGHFFWLQKEQDRPSIDDFVIASGKPVIDAGEVSMQVEHIIGNRPGTYKFVPWVCRLKK